MVRRFESLDEIRAIRGYVEQVRDGTYELNDEPLGYYRFKDSVHCARCSCNRPHKFGYVVSTTAGVFIIGNVCGVRLLGGQAFKRVAAVVDSARRRHDLHLALVEYLSSLPRYQQRFEKLLVEAAALMTAEASLQAVCPRYVLDDLYRRVSAGRDGAEVKSSRPRTKRDPEPLPGENRRYVEELHGRLQGLGALKIPSAKSILEDRLLRPLASFQTFTAEMLMSSRPQRDWFTRWHRGVITELEAVESRLRAAPHFFATDNLRLLSYLTKSASDRARLARLTWNSATGRVEIAGKDAA